MGLILPQVINRMTCNIDLVIFDVNRMIKHMIKESEEYAPNIPLTYVDFFRSIILVILVKHARLLY